MQGVESISRPHGLLCLEPIKKTSKKQQEQSRKRLLLDELKVCDLHRGREIHVEAVASENGSCIYFSTALVKMYAKCGSMVDARQLFDVMKHPDVVSWTALILGYADNGEGFEALDQFRRMRSRGCKPSSYTFVAALKACTALIVDNNVSRAQCLEHGKKIHWEIPAGYLSDVYVQTTLINMYAKCGCMKEARKVFDGMRQPSVVTWTALILGYADNGEGVTALDLFSRMKFQGCKPVPYTFAAALKACTSLALGNARAECLAQGREIHSEIGRHFDMFVQIALINMYSKCRSMVDARQVFDSIKRPNVVAWTALILGYADNGEGVSALDSFARMKSQACTPDYLTFAAVLKACTLLGALEMGKKIHSEMDEGSERHVIVVTTLVDFYAKCGSLVEARRVFDLHPSIRNLNTWTALLAGYGRLGDVKPALELFQGLQGAGFQANGVTFLSILSCCSHAGLTGLANELFKAMSTKYGIAPALEHYSCMVDILGRSNMLADAMALLRSMTCRPNAVTWLALLGACRKWKNVAIAQLAFTSLVELDDTNAAAYVLMVCIYRSAGMWKEQETLLDELRATKAATSSDYCEREPNL